jgi:N-acyl-D-amino-acid deacylase
MTFDTIIRGGLVVDGTGAAARRADIGIEGGVIKAVGEISAEARESIDASGMVVTPGFIDLHTHLDAQVGWDPLLRPLTYHGVTTALMGNCGVTFAPCRPNDRALLAEMMESVEDIPRAAILEGLPWSWESYGEYLDRALPRSQAATATIRPPAPLRIDRRSGQRGANIAPSRPTFRQV